MGLFSLIFVCLNFYLSCVSLIIILALLYFIYTSPFTYLSLVSSIVRRACVVKAGFGFGRVDMEERYEALKELGSGNFGVARLVRDKKTKELVAVKYIERGKKVKPFQQN